MKLIISIIATWLFVAPVTAQNLNESETISYMANSLDDAGPATIGRLNACAFSFVFSASTNDYMRIRFHRASDIDPNDVRVINGGLIVTNNFRDMIQTGAITVESPGLIGLALRRAFSDSNIVTFPMASFETPRKQTATRVGRALVHLIDICDDDPFK